MNEDKIYNEVDTECSFVDEDDLGGFGGDCDARPVKTISVQAEENGLRTIKNWDDPNEDYSNVNEIDMECDVCEDDDEPSFAHIKSETYRHDAQPKELDTSIYYGETVDDWGDDDDEEEKYRSRKTSKNINSDDYVMSDDVPYDDTEELDEKELIDEEMIEEKKKSSTGEVEDDYYKKLQKKHKDSNVKGSYNMSMHFCGDPEAEMAAFNAGFSSNGGPSGDAGGGEGCCEDLEVKIDNVDWTAVAKALLSILGFELLKDDNGFVLHDECETCPDVCCKNNEEIFASLKPYVDDCFIFPLQFTTGEKFNNCKDWCDWYKGENCSKFPRCADDIKYCDLVANHINDCKF